MFHQERASPEACQTSCPEQVLHISRYSSGQLYPEQSSVVFLQQNHDSNRKKYSRKVNKKEKAN